MTDWTSGMLGMVSRSDVLAPPAESPLYSLGRRMADVVCASCGERLGMVTDEAGGPHFTHWAPTVSVRADNTGEPFYTVVWGTLPEPSVEVVVHCFNHGHAMIDGRRLATAADRYRQRGRTVRLVLEPRRS